ncbi:protein of unknown function [Seinonella peptonophila]|uniref:DUF2935 domain-containing protein n=1 Tax=Seinonella peptonophila TaxID=112248 RepID=A0A1M5B0M3_9BACL|nr:DUF2935 domain-containing protein [Seinonella peptonophila]SHF35867.1 protein of unknown function [Seinonella peptonophila]
MKGVLILEHLEEVITYEQSFWLHILKDHCQFIYDALSPNEKKEAHRAKELYFHIQELIEERIYDLAASEKVAKRLRKFKLHLLKRLLTEEFAFHLSPTFINHMVNELEEYLRILSYLCQNKRVPPLHVLHQHLLWLPDAAGHATGLNENIDGTEKEWLKKTEIFTKHFEAFYLKAIELAGYLRTNCKDFPALRRFTQDVELEIKLFQRFLKEVEEMTTSKTLLGTIAPLMADHMYREECYYLEKLK